jgi:Protein of unknown function (DUF1569)
MPNAARRSLRFETLDDAILDARHLCEIEQAGKLRTSGSWTLGQALNHLATWVDYAYDGAPVRVPFFIPWVMTLLKNKVLNQAMKTGARIPGVKDGTIATEIVPAPDSFIHLQKSYDRLANQVPAQPSPLFGRLTHTEWIKLHLRHAELHLSFLAAQ